MKSLFKHQLEAVDKLSSGTILCGGVGTGKSLVALTYYKKLKIDKLYIITTARKRDTLDWEKEAASINMLYKKNIIVDSWNNIKKYINIKNAFFIFDEQRLIGNGVWVKSFYKISKNNKWIILTATPGDTWLDYIPVFVANGFYKNRTDFILQHVIYSRYSKFPKVDRFVNTIKLDQLKKSILIDMHYLRNTKRFHSYIKTKYNKQDYDVVLKKRWNIFEQKPIVHITHTLYILRKIVNTDKSRIIELKTILKKHNKAIVFYNFNYELDLLKIELCEYNIAEWNGKKHEPIPKSKQWVYLVQYIAGAEGWNCIETDTIIFYSQNYSYKLLAQAVGRIDRLNTPFINLYYYHFISDSSIDINIKKALDKKENFNIREFLDSREKHVVY